MTEITCAEAGRRGGSSKSPRKARAARLNGRRGGRPRKSAPPATETPVPANPESTSAAPGWIARHDPERIGE